MEKLKLDLGVVRLAIDDDEHNVLEFVPGDVALQERFFAVIHKLDDIEKELTAKGRALDTSEVDQNGMPVNMRERLAFQRETCEHLRTIIDDCFGEGTSQKVFGNVNTIRMFEEFIRGVEPYFRAASKKKVEQYTNRADRRSKKGRVLK